MTRAARKTTFGPALTVPIGAVLALVWANVAPDSYFRVAVASAFAINSVGMALAFALAMQEVIEELIPGGALHPWPRAVLPVIAGVGGTLGAIGVYFAYVHTGDELLLSIGWPVVCVVDTALGYVIVRSLLRGQGETSFFLLLAIATNAIGLIAVGLSHPVLERHLAGLLLIPAAIVISTVMARAKVRSFWPHLLISGTLSWLGFAWSGLHPALALLPIVPFFPHAPRDLELFADAPHGPHDSPRHFEHVFRIPVLVVVFLFALINAGVLLRGHGTGSWAVLWATLAGRPIGILLSVALASVAGLRLPRDVGWRSLVVIAWAASIGFAFALFAATATVPFGPVRIEIQFGALLTIAGAVIAVILARLLRAGRVAGDPAWRDSPAAAREIASRDPASGDARVVNPRE